LAADAALAALSGPAPLEEAAMVATAPLLPVRDQVHQALTFLTVQAAPKLIVALHGALFGGTLASGQLPAFGGMRSVHSRPTATVGRTTSARR
jgi:hypothetical protein